MTSTKLNILSHRLLFCESECPPTMKTDVTYSVKMSILVEPNEQSRKIPWVAVEMLSCECSCKAGRSRKCPHALALLYLIDKTFGTPKNYGTVKFKFKMEKGYSLRPAKPVLSELQQCVLEITNGDLSYREAQEKYGFSKSTLQRHAVQGSQTPLSAGAQSKLTDIEFESIAEKCRANFIGNQQTDVTTLKKYVADETGARGVQWLNGVPREYMKAS